MSWKVRRELSILFVLLIPAIASILYELFAFAVEGDRPEYFLRILIPAALTLWLFQFIVKTAWRKLHTY